MDIVYTKQPNVDLLEFILVHWPKYTGPQFFQKFVFSGNFTYLTKTSVNNSQSNQLILKMTTPAIVFRYHQLYCCLNTHVLPGTVPFTIGFCCGSLEMPRWNTGSICCRHWEQRNGWVGFCSFFTGKTYNRRLGNHTIRFFKSQKISGGYGLIARKQKERRLDEIAAQTELLWISSHRWL